MSVHVMSWVLRHSEEKLGNRLVLLVLADHAADDGTDAWPSVDTIASEARLSRRQVQRCLRELEASGAIIPAGRSHKSTTVWGVNMSPPEDDIYDAEGATSTTNGGDRMSPEPSLEPSKEQPSKDLAAAPREYDPLKGIKLGGRNQPWDALVQVTQADEKVEAGQIARALKLIRSYVAPLLSPQVIAEPMAAEAIIVREIRGRARLYRQRWPNVELTPTALAKNWSRVTTAQPGSDPVSTMEAAQRGIDEARSTT